MNINTLPVEDGLKKDILDMSCDSLFYLPNGGNAGDAVIAHAEFELFDDLGLKYTQVHNSNKDTFHNDIEKFSFIYGDGGIWCGLYNVDYQLSIFKNPKLDRCLILPSTFHNCDDVVKLFDERFVVYCRDPKSLEYCKSLNQKATFKLHVDLAFTFDARKFLPLDGIDGLHDGLKEASEKLKAFANGNEWGTVSFMRQDAERTPNTAIPDSFDLSALKITTGLFVTKALAHDTTRLMMYAVNRYDRIITNRLHVAILAYMLDKDIELYDNSYGKVYDVSKWSIVPNYGRCRLMQEDVLFPANPGFQQLFEHSFVISRDTPRFQNVENSLNSIGIHPRKWQAVKYARTMDEIPGVEYGQLGCSTSHISIVKMANYLDWDCVAIFEEDCSMSDEFDLDFLKCCLGRIPPDCDALAMGHEWTNMASGYFSPIAKVTGIFGSHAYILFKRGYEKYQKVFAKKAYHADRVLEHLNTYAIFPSMFSQRKYKDRIHR